MSQVETVRLDALGVPRAEIRRFEERGRRPDRRRHAATALKARLAELIAAQPAATTFGDTGLDETLTRDARRRCAASPKPRCCRTRTSGTSKNEYIPLEVIGQARRARRVRPDAARGVRRPGARQGGDVRRLRGAVARLHRRRLARHALGDRRRADPGRRHRGAEAEVSAARSPPASCCRRPCSPSPTPAPTSPRSRRARCARATSTRSRARRPGSRIPCAPT